MSLLHVNYFSQALQKQSAMYVMLPEGAEGPYRVVYQLHGLSDDYTIWLRRTSIERYADKYGLAIVLLDGHRFFYTDAKQCAARYEQHILESVRYVDRTFRTVDDPAGRAIGGLSMGGYGAMKLGLKYPDLFGSIASHSSAMDIAALLAESSFVEDLRVIYGETLDPRDDCFALAEQCSRVPRIYFDCGVDDFLIAHNRRFHAHLEALKIPHQYCEYPGEHTWEYWDTHVPEALAFHRESMRAGV